MVERVGAAPDSRTPSQGFSEPDRATTMATTRRRGCDSDPVDGDVAQSSDDQGERHDQDDAVRSLREDGA
jgi:hypothetical protein